MCIGLIGHWAICALGYTCIGLYGHWAIRALGYTGFRLYGPDWRLFRPIHNFPLAKSFSSNGLIPKQSTEYYAAVCALHPVLGDEAFTGPLTPGAWCGWMKPSQGRSPQERGVGG